MMRLRAALPALAAVAGVLTVATAQAGEEASLYVPAQSVANPDGALSLFANPAGYGTAKSWDFRSQFSLGGGIVGAGAASERQRGSGIGEFVAIPLGPLALAGGYEALGTSVGQRTSFGASINAGAGLAIGAAGKWASLANGASWRTWDLGVLARPARWLSIGGRLRNLGEAGGEQAGFETRWAGGAALRPLWGGDRLTLTGEIEGSVAKGGVSAWLATAALRIVDGVDLLAEHQAFFGASGTSARTGVSLSFGFGQYGTAVGMHNDLAANGERKWGSTVGIRLSGDHVAGLFDGGDFAVAVPLRGELVERRGAAGTHFGQLLLTLQQIGNMPATKVVVLRPEHLQADWAQAEELRDAISTLRKQGKKVLWFGDEIGTRALGIAAACDLVWLAPGGSFGVQGVAADYISLAEALTRTGIAVQVVRYRDHKSAAEPLVNPVPSKELAATLQHSVERRWQDLAQWVQMGRDVSPAALEAALSAGAVFPQDAKAAKLIDAVVAVRDLDTELHKAGWLPAGERVRKWSAPVVRDRLWGNAPAVAVIEIEGAIGDHREGTGMLGRTLGGTEIAETVERAQKDGGVKAIVARIVSGGGSVYGSEAMRESLEQAAKHKPVIASMGSVAASGGFWTSLGADTVLADRATVTGSIGIISFKPSTQELMARYGIRSTQFTAGPGAGVGAMTRPYTPEEVALLYRQLGRYYQMFLERTANRRKLSVPEVDAVAGGRIWFGDEALQRKLIDKQGGLLQAITEAKARAGISDADEPVVRFVPGPSLTQQFKSALGLATAQSELLSMAETLRAAAGPWLDAAAVVQAMGQSAPLAIDDAAMPERGP